MKILRPKPDYFAVGYYGQGFPTFLRVNLINSCFFIYFHSPFVFLFSSWLMSRFLFWPLICFELTCSYQLSCAALSFSWMATVPTLGQLCKFGLVLFKYAESTLFTFLWFWLWGKSRLQWVWFFKETRWTWEVVHNWIVL